MPGGKRAPESRFRREPLRTLKAWTLLLPFEIEMPSVPL
jgi:hypothetical protein